MSVTSSDALVVGDGVALVLLGVVQVVFHNDGLQEGGDAELVVAHGTGGASSSFVAFSNDVEAKDVGREDLLELVPPSA